MTDAVVVDGVSRWFRDRVAVADVSFNAGPGVTGPPLITPSGVTSFPIEKAGQNASTRAASH